LVGPYLKLYSGNRPSAWASSMATFMIILCKSCKYPMLMVLLLGDKLAVLTT